MNVTHKRIAMNTPREFTPPKFCPDAVASNAGWLNPRDNSLIVPNRGLATRMAEWKARQKQEKEPEVINTVEQVVDEPKPKRQPRKTKKNS